MTDIEIDALTGRELDCSVARSLGYEPEGSARDGRWIMFPKGSRWPSSVVPHYHSDLGAAMRLMLECKVSTAIRLDSGVSRQIR